MIMPHLTVKSQVDPVLYRVDEAAAATAEPFVGL